MFNEKVNQTVPRFLSEGYALYEGEDFSKGVHDGVEVILGNKHGLDSIGLKENAPAWAKEEYKEWMAISTVWGSVDEREQAAIH